MKSILESDIINNKITSNYSFNIPRAYLNYSVVLKKIKEIIEACSKDSLSIEDCFGKLLEYANSEEAISSLNKPSIVPTPEITNFFQGLDNANDIQSYISNVITNDYIKSFFDYNFIDLSNTLQLLCAYALSNSKEYSNTREGSRRPTTL